MPENHLRTATLSVLGEMTAWSGRKMEDDGDEAEEGCYHLLNAHHVPGSVFA